MRLQSPRFLWAVKSARPAALSLWMFITVVGAASAHAQDFQSWNEVDLTARLRGVNFLLPLLARTDTRLPNPQLAATGLTADFPLPWHLTLTAGYLFADLPQRSDLVHIPLLALTPSFRLGRLTVADRNRFEKLFGYGSAPIRYRNRVLLDWPFGARKRWHLFATEELIFDLSAAAWSQNRLQVGGGARLTRRLFLDLYGLQRDSAGPAPRTRVLGTTLRIELASR